MAERCSGNALMTAGLIGVGLLVAGAARRALRSDTGS